MPKLIIPGGSGFLGKALVRHFVQQNWEVIVLSRHRPERGVGRWLPWDGVRLGPWAAEFEGATAVVNLAGRTVNCRYTAQNMLDIYTSRIDSTRAVGRAIQACTDPPPVWLNASTATIYRHAEDRPQDEFSGEIGHGFSVDVGRRWEAALMEVDLPHTRRVALRTGMVFGAGAGGVMQTTDRVVRLGLAGPMAGGRQYLSWMHIRDFVRSVQFLIDHDLSGPVNVTAPGPLPNADFLWAYRQAWGVPIGLPSTAFLIRLGALLLGSEAELLLKSRWAVPTRLQEAGFVFDRPTWPEAIQGLVAEVRVGGHH